MQRGWVGTASHLGSVVGFDNERTNSERISKPVGLQVSRRTEQAGAKPLIAYFDKNCNYILYCWLPPFPTRLSPCPRLAALVWLLVFLLASTFGVGFAGAGGSNLILFWRGSWGYRHARLVFIIAMPKHSFQYVFSDQLVCPYLFA